MAFRHATVRMILTVAFPFFLFSAVVITLFREIGNAFHYTWLEVRIQFEEYRRQMRREDY